MERVSFESGAAVELGGGTTRRCLADPLDATHVAINRYRVPPGGGLPGGLHAHMDQEEVFVVIEGEATFETMAGEVVVGGGEAVRFARGEFQSGRNDGEADLVALALGAPRDSDDIRLPFPCPACGFDELRLESGEGELTFGCPGCGAVQMPSPCPTCGDEDLLTTLNDCKEPVVVCQGCGAAYEEPPIED